VSGVIGAGVDAIEGIPDKLDTSVETPPVVDPDDAIFSIGGGFIVLSIESFCFIIFLKSSMEIPSLGKSFSIDRTSSSSAC
jgi:hypothetical protein